MLFGDNEQDKPVVGETLVDSETVPVNPWIVVTMIVEAPLAPAFTVTLDGLACIWKSWTVTDTVAE